MRADCERDGGAGLRQTEAPGARHTPHHQAGNSAANSIQDFPAAMAEKNSAAEEIFGLLVTAFIG
jgi:hypothetical protein